jgi:alpha-mannosidase
MTPTVVVVSHTHWDREWYQPFEVFRLRLAHMVEALLDLLDGNSGFRCFMLDGQTVCVDDVLALRPSLGDRLRAHIAAGRITIGPWYVLQDEFLVGAESIVRNLAVGLASARRWGEPMRIGYLPDAFGHIAQMPRILRGFDIDSAVVWRGVGDRAPGAEWRWRALGRAEVLCLFLPGGYGNAARLGSDGAAALERLRGDLATALPMSRAGVLLWMNGNDHQPAERSLPSLLAALRAALPEVDIEHASLERAVELVRARIDVKQLPVVEGELRSATPTVPVLSGTWSSRSWQKRDHDRAQALLVRLAEPFVALAGIARREELDRAWRTLLECQPHDSICGCSVDEVHRDVDARLRQVAELAAELVDEAVDALVETRTPTSDFGLHRAIAILNPHPFVASVAVEVAIQRLVADGPFRLRGPTGEVGYAIVARTPTDGPGLQPAEWLRLRIDARDLPPHGVRVVVLEPGEPSPSMPPPTTLAVHPIFGGVEIVDGESHLRIAHTFEDEGDRGDLYDFCPREGEPVRSSRHEHLGVHLEARPIGRRVEIDVDIDNRTPDHRLRARFDLSAPPESWWTDTAFGWLERSGDGTHPVSTAVVARGPMPVAFGGLGLHEVERGRDGNFRLTLFRAVGWMSRGDLATRPGHAGYNVETPDAEGLGHLRFRYAIALGPDAVRELEAAIVPARAVALDRGDLAPADRPFLSIEPASVRLSICKRADDGRALVVRVIGPPDGATARLRLFRPIRAAWLSDLDERVGPPLTIRDDTVDVAIPPNDVVTLRIDLH